MLLATGGVISFLAFLTLAAKILNSNFGNSGFLIRGTVIAVIVHSLFANSLFYPWVMGIIAILLGLSQKNTGTKETETVF